MVKMLYGNPQWWDVMKYFINVHLGKFFVYLYLTEVDLIIGKLLMKWFIVKDCGSKDNNFCHLKKN